MMPGRAPMRRSTRTNSRFAYANSRGAGPGPRSNRGDYPDPAFGVRADVRVELAISRIRGRRRQRDADIGDPSDRGAWDRAALDGVLDEPHRRHRRRIEKRK